MALEHTFLAIEDSATPNLSFYNSDALLEGSIREHREIVCVGDDFLQTLLFDEFGKAKDNLPFNEWGITIIDANGQKNWIRFLLRERKAGGANSTIDELLGFFKYTSDNHLVIIHFGV
jgi:hypothetical protein